jgi:UDP-glucuronate 4-epimerase
MKIFCTGVAGFIGSHAVERLLARGDVIIGLDNLDETLYPAALHERNLAILTEHPRSAGLTFQRGSLTDERALEDLFARHRFDLVLHLGALAGVRPSLAQPLRYAHVNVHGTLLILEAMRKHGVGRLVFASSSSVYGARSEAPFREGDSVTHPASPYAATKAAGELLCDSYASLYGLSVTSLRFFTAYGPRGRPDMAIAKFARAILEGAPLPFFGDGSTARDYTYIDDIIDGVVAAVDGTAARGGHQVYNLGESRTTTLAELVALLEERLGKKAVLDRKPAQPGDVPLTCADLSAARAALGYAPRVQIEDGLTRFCDWLLAQSR